MIVQDINKEIQDFQTRQIQIVPGLYFNQYANIQQIYFYYSSKFKTGNIDDEGDRKYFYNINRNPCKIYTKGIDFDTKNIRLLTVEGGDSLKTWFMERDLKYWMRDKQFGKILNRIFFELPIFGTVVLKIVDGTPYFVDLRNFVVEQGADDLDSMNYKTEIHNFTVADFRRVAKKMNWDASKVKETIDLYYRMKDRGSHIKIYERYGDTQNKDESYSYKRTFIADVGDDEYNDKRQLILEHPGVLLEEKEWDGHPYWEFHAEKMPGRWQGIGVVETLYEPQIRENELTNVQAKATYWAGLRLFQSRDPKTAGNLMADKRNGEVIITDAEVTQIDMSDRNLAFFNEEHGKWTQNIDKLTIAFAPVGHSVIAIQIAQDQVVTYFEQIQENIAMDVKEMLYEVIMPQFQKDNTSEHTLRIVGQDLDQYIAMCKNDLVMKEVIRQVVETTRGQPFPTNHDRDIIAIAVDQSIRQGKEKLLTIPKGFYENLKYDVDIDITGESVDSRGAAAAKFAILQAITADPTMTTDPTKRKILFSYMEDAGINPNDFFDSTTNSQDALAGALPPGAVPGRAGGGVSAPVSNQPGLPGKTTTL